MANPNAHDCHEHEAGRGAAGASISQQKISAALPRGVYFDFDSASCGGIHVSLNKRAVTQDHRPHRLLHGITIPSSTTSAHYNRIMRRHVITHTARTPSANAHEQLILCRHWRYQMAR